MVDDEAHEQRLDHLQRPRKQREQKYRGDGVAMRFEPTQIVADVLPPIAFRLGGGRGLALLGGRQGALRAIRLRAVIETLVSVVFDELPVSFARGEWATLAHRVDDCARARSAQGCGARVAGRSVIVILSEAKECAARCRSQHIPGLYGVVRAVRAHSCTSWRGEQEQARSASDSI